MPVSVAVGSLAKSATAAPFTSTSAGTGSLTGLSFQPKVLLLFGAATNSATTATTTNNAYAQNEQASDVGKCSNEANFASAPGSVAHQCYTVRDDQVPIGSEEECGQYLAEPVAATVQPPDDEFGAANFNCGHPSDTNP